MQIAIIAFDDFTDIDLILHWDLLNRVRYICGYKDWNVRILGTKPVHTSVLGLPIPTSGTIDQVVEADGVILCSGKGTRALLNDKDFLMRLRIDPEKQTIGAQCSGSLILGAKGFLKDIRVTAYPPILQELKQLGAIPVNEALVVDGKVGTASSCLAGQFLSKWMIESLVGASVAEDVMKTVSPVGL